MVKNMPANSGDARDTSSIPGARRSPGIGNGNPSQSSCLENSTSKEPGGLQSMGCVELGTTEHTHTRLCLPTELQ